MELNWLDDGNLYILLPDALAATWTGVFGGDYDRACGASDDWLNLLPVGESVGLVLGGDSGMALVVPQENGEVVLIRWLFADDEQELVAMALRGEGATRTEPDLLFDSPEPQWRLFDAAAELRKGGVSSLSVVLPVGRVRARTALLETGRSAAIVHRFTAAPSSGAGHPE